MPFCTRCGKNLGEGDVFCGSCGTRQSGPGLAAGPAPASAGMSPRTASMLCYIPFVGWIASIFVLASQGFRDRRDVRFHAFQGLYLFVAWLIVDWVVKPSLHFAAGFLLPVGKLLQLLLFAVWIFMMVKAAREERYSLPVIGELAERSL